MSRLRSVVRHARPRPGAGARARRRNAHRRRRLATAVRPAAELTATWLIGDALVRVQIDFVHAPLRSTRILSTAPRCFLKLYVGHLGKAQATPFTVALVALRAVVLKHQRSFFSGRVA